MYGDFSRDTYDPDNYFTGVLMQQGRLIVDADWNEQQAIMLNCLRTLVGDMIGWHGGPGVTSATDEKPGTGPFQIVPVGENNDSYKIIGEGRYYIDGWQISWAGEVKADDIEVLNGAAAEFENQIVFVEVYEYHVPAVSTPGLCDPALLGLDTSDRSKLAVTLKRIGLANNAEAAIKRFREAIAQDDIRGETPSVDPRKLKNPPLPQLAARVGLKADDAADCIEDDYEAEYAGIENQLYRVEVHHEGDLLSSKNDSTACTIKWSRDNGSIVFSGKRAGNSVTLYTRWRDGTRQIFPNDIVEVMTLGKSSGTLVRVDEIDDLNGHKVLKFTPPEGAALPPDGSDVVIRRWDHGGGDSPLASDNGILVKRTSEERNVPTSEEILLEDDLRITLRLPDGSMFRVGDYWQIPARIALPGIMWPRYRAAELTSGDDKENDPKFMSAHFIDRRYAPVAFFKKNAAPVDLRRSFDGIAKPSNEN
jgi:hypothetical protein